MLKIHNNKETLVDFSNYNGPFYQNFLLQERGHKAQYCYRAKQDQHYRL